METMREKIPFINTEIVKLPHQSTYIRFMVLTILVSIRISTKSLKRAIRNMSTVKFVDITILMNLHSIETHIFLNEESHFHQQKASLKFCLSIFS